MFALLNLFYSLFLFSSFDFSHSSPQIPHISEGVLAEDMEKNRYDMLRCLLSILVELRMDVVDVIDYPWDPIPNRTESLPLAQLNRTISLHSFLLDKFGVSEKQHLISLISPSI